jgi:subtilisin-like proprotein convertase family protein
MSVFFWGENPSGTWKLIVENTGSIRNSGLFKEWQLILYGTETHPVNLKEPLEETGSEGNGFLWPTTDNVSLSK